MDSRRAWLVWSIGVVAYMVAVLHRTSFGVAGIVATDRFGATASLLSLFTVIQLLVYVALQVPVGVLLDRVGPRALVACGALVMAAGQLVLALSDSVPLAIAGRLLVGAGDATTFISVLRLIPSWFGPRRVPVLSQVTGILGQVGQVLSAVPFLAVLSGPGWLSAFVGAAALGVVVAAVSLAVLRDAAPGTEPVRASIRVGEVWRSVRTTWVNPGTRLGFWTHWSTMFTATVFTLLWGMPFVVSAEGYGPAEASVLFALIVVLGAVTGPVLGGLTARHPLRRSWLVFGVVALSAAGWALVLAWPGRAPFWVLVLLVVTQSFVGPGSMIGFDYARTSNEPANQGAAAGIVNAGGFVATLASMYLIGMVLDLLHASGGGELYDLGSFRVALCVQYVVMAVGLVGVLRCRTLLRRRLAADGCVVPGVREAWVTARALHRGI